MSILQPPTLSWALLRGEYWVLVTSLPLFTYLGPMTSHPGAFSAPPPPGSEVSPGLLTSLKEQQHPHIPSVGGNGLKAQGLQGRVRTSPRDPASPRTGSCAQGLLGLSQELGVCVDVREGGNRLGKLSHPLRRSLDWHQIQDTSKWYHWSSETIWGQCHGKVARGGGGHRGWGDRGGCPSRLVSHSLSLVPPEMTSPHLGHTAGGGPPDQIRVGQKKGGWHSISSSSWIENPE